MTLLFNQLGGLKILPPSSDGYPEDRENEEKWLWVAPLRGHCVVNLGDAMVKFTRGILRSNVHKVVGHSRFCVEYVPVSQTEHGDAQNIC